MWIKAKVIKGLEIGAKFGIATANLEFFTLPDIQEGVYLVSVRFGQQLYGGLLHFGPRKTFGGDFSAEVHLLDFNKDIYHEILELKVKKKLRSVKAFKNADALFTQIETDIIKARKYFLRQKIRQHWQALSLSDEARLATVALDHLAASAEFLEAQTLFVYAPVLHKEITFVASLMKAFPGKKYCFPKIENNKMRFYSVDDYQALRPGEWSILEPPKTKEVHPQEDDIVIVPAQAADIKGNRLGQGGGFYDQYLAALKSNPRRMAVLPAFAIVLEIPVEKHDQSLDKVISCEI